MSFSPQKSSKIAALIFLALANLALLYFSRPPVLRLSWNDEMLYYATARNIRENFDFNSQYYLSESLLKKGYPTKDTHPPGFPLLLAGAFVVFGEHEWLPVALNQLLTLATALLVFFTTARISCTRGGLGASLLYLLFPMTLPLGQSAMSESSACFFAAFLLWAWVYLKEGVFKGIFLALLLVLGMLIKPLFASFALPMALALWLRKGSSLRTLTTMSLVLLALGIGVIRPGFSNREFYPYPGSDLFSSPTLAALWNAAWKNISTNLKQLMSWEGTGIQSKTVLAIGLLLIWPLALLCKKNPAEDSKNLKLISTILLIAFFQSVLAVFSLYEYRSWRGLRALVFFTPGLAILNGAAWARFFNATPHTAKNSRRVMGALLALGVLGLLGNSSWQLSQEWKKNQARDFYYFNQWSERLGKSLAYMRTQPRMALSHRNFLFPIQNYPIRLIWTLPKNLEELESIAAKTPLDLIELKSSDPLFRENHAKLGNDEQLGSQFRLFHQQGGYFYYLRDVPSPTANFITSTR